MHRQRQDVNCNAIDLEAPRRAGGNLPYDGPSQSDAIVTAPKTLGHFWLTPAARRIAKLQNPKAAPCLDMEWSGSLPGCFGEHFATIAGTSAGRSDPNRHLPTGVDTVRCRRMSRDRRAAGSASGANRFSRQVRSGSSRWHICASHRTAERCPFGRGSVAFSCALSWRQHGCGPGRADPTG